MNLTAAMPGAAREERETIMFFEDDEYRATNRGGRILELTPGHFDATVCTLCGAYGEDVDWYWGYSQESFRVFVAIQHALAQVKNWDDGMDLHVAAEHIAEEVDPIAYQNQDEVTVCAGCVKATPIDLRKRIRAHADQLDEAGYSTAHCTPGDDYLADYTLRDRGRWVRRHVGYELVVADGWPVARCDGCGEPKSPLSNVGRGEMLCPGCIDARKAAVLAGPHGISDHPLSGDQFEDIAPGEGPFYSVPDGCSCNPGQPF